MAPRPSSSTLAILVMCTAICACTAATVVLELDVKLEAPPQVPSGFGDKVALDYTGGTIAVQGEWNDTSTDPAGVSRSGIFIAHRVSGLDYNTPDGWQTIREPAELVAMDPIPEFGTTIKLTASGRQLLAALEDITLTAAQSQEVSVGYLFRQLVNQSNFTQYGPAINVTVPIDDQTLSVANENTTITLDTCRGLMNFNGTILAFTTQLTSTTTLPEGSDPAEISTSLPGQVYIFHNSTSGTFVQTQVITSPLGNTPNSTFGKNSVMSGSGLWIAVTEDFNSAVYLYAKKSVQTTKYSLVANVTGMFPGTNGTESMAEIEDLKLSADGQYLAVAWKMPTSSDPATSEAGAFAVYSRSYSKGVYKFTLLCRHESSIQGLDGMAMASWKQGYKTKLRLVLGYAGNSTQVWDIDTAAVLAGGACPKEPAYMVSAEGLNTIDPNDPTSILTVFEAVELSGDGKTLALGAEAQNAVYMLSIPRF